MIAGMAMGASLTITLHKKEGDLGWGHKKSSEVLVAKWLAISVLLIVGCAHKKMIQIDSEPQGANVDFDGAYLGKTPLKEMVKRRRNEWSNRIYASEVKASFDECVESKQIGKDQETPDRMFFDFTKCLKTKGKAGTAEYV